MAPALYIDEVTQYVLEQVHAVDEREVHALPAEHLLQRVLREEVVTELRASTPLVAANLERLQRSGLAVEEDGRFRFAPAGEAMKRLCDDVAEAYRERPVAVINLIAAPEDPIQGLADAFKFKGGA